jgi:hypothetical protein
MAGRTGQAVRAKEPMAWHDQARARVGLVAGWGNERPTVPQKTRCESNEAETGSRLAGKEWLAVLAHTFSKSTLGSGTRKGESGEGKGRKGTGTRKSKYQLRGVD